MPLRITAILHGQTTLTDIPDDVLILHSRNALGNQQDYQYVKPAVGLYLLIPFPFSSSSTTSQYPSATYACPQIVRLEPVPAIERQDLQISYISSILCDNCERWAYVKVQPE